MKHLRGIVESPTAPNTTNVLWLDADGGLKAFKNGGWKALVEKGSGGNSGGNGGNAAEPNIIYETDIIMYDYAAIQPKIEQGENLVKTDNLDNAFVKLNLMLAEKGKFNSVLIPVQHIVVPIAEGGQSANIDMLTGRYDVTYNIPSQIRLAINICIGYMEGLSFIAIEPLKVHNVEITVKDIYALGEREYELDTPFITNLKMNQFSEIHLKSALHSSSTVRLNNVLYSGNENDPNYDTFYTINGSYISGNNLYKVEIIMDTDTTPLVRIKTYQLTPTT